MAYTPTVHVDGTTLYAADVNALEQGLAAASTAAAVTTVDGGQAWAAKVTQRAGDMAVGIAGDSTADTNTEWFYLAWARWALARPWLTCNHRFWSDGTQAYGSTVAIQTGTGTQVIELYNASFSGSVLTYQQSRLALMFPVPLDVLFINSCHNYFGHLGATYIPLVEAFIAAFRAVQPQAGIVIVSQNPKLTPVSAQNISDHADRLRALRPFAASRGYGYLPVAEKFMTYPDGGDSLIDADGYHPSAGGVRSGSTVWADVAVDYLNGLT